MQDTALFFLSVLRRLIPLSTIYVCLLEIYIDKYQWHRWISILWSSPELFLAITWLLTHGYILIEYFYQRNDEKSLTSQLSINLVTLDAVSLFCWLSAYEYIWANVGICSYWEHSSWRERWGGAYLLCTLGLHGSHNTFKIKCFFHRFLLLYYCMLYFVLV